jgi:Asp/Glu/hydantoin racemase
MPRILLINPNTSAATTQLMLAIARASAPAGIEVEAATAAHGPSMITTADELEHAASEVMAIANRTAAAFDGIVIAAFGDPGLEALRQTLAMSVVGIGEAAMLEAAEGRSFGVATVTPGLAAATAAMATRLGLADRYTGIRLTEGDPQALAASPDGLENALAKAVRACIELDHAEAVVIGGGPLGRAATALAPRFAAPIIAPIPAAIRRMIRMLTYGRLLAP